MRTRIGCLVEIRAFPIMRSSRSRVRINRPRRRIRTEADTFTVVVSRAMEPADSPALIIHDRGLGHGVIVLGLVPIRHQPLAIESCLPSLFWSALAPNPNTTQQAKNPSAS